MKSVGLVAKPGHSEAVVLSRELIAWFQKRGVEFALEPGLGRDLGLEDFTRLNDFCDHDFIVVLGGDGTLLHAARRVGLCKVPLLGVNLGNLGFLTAVATGQVFAALEKIFQGELAPEERMRLAVRVVRGDKTIFESVVLNDAVLTKEALARILDLSASINGRRLTDYRADGLIVSTPTGSTAYNLSAGGPILHPSLSAMIITPICPFILANRPLVVPGEVELTIKPGPSAEDVYLTCDGQEGLPLTLNDKVVISRTKSLWLFPSPLTDHYSILRTKLGWGVTGTANSD